MFEYWNATELEVIEYVRRKLLEQGAPARSGFSCEYLRGDGFRCAAGHLIPDQIIDKLNLSGPWHIVLSKNLNLPNTHQSLISKLQIIHDRWLDGDDLPWCDYINERFDIMALRYG